MDSLPIGCYVEVSTHENDFELLKFTYERYLHVDNVVAHLIIPTFGQIFDANYFQYMNPGNILFLDRKPQGVKHPAIWQDFTLGFYEALMAEQSVLRKYSRLVFYTKYFTNTIIEQMKEGLTRFAQSMNIPFVHKHTMFSEKEIYGNIRIDTGDLLIILDDYLLVEALRTCEESKYKPGKEVGIIIINDGSFCSRLKTPISVLSTDFYLMGTTAASFVLNGHIQPTRIPTRLQVRPSI